MDKSKFVIKNTVREDYAKVAKGGHGMLGKSCCGTEADMQSLHETGRLLGYSDEELSLGLGEANLGIGCGNPQAIAELSAGETVLDLGAGAGFDALLAGMSVGPDGRVIGVDMTSEMLLRARENAGRLKAENVEFRLGEIEHLPLADGEIDVIISNCVVNLSVDKQAVFHECFRVLRPGGRIAISDILRGGEIATDVLDNPAAYSG